MSRVTVAMAEHIRRDLRMHGCVFLSDDTLISIAVGEPQVAWTKSHVAAVRIAARTLGVPVKFEQVEGGINA